MIDKKDISKLFENFEAVANIDENGVTYWSARELQGLLEYTRWETFETALERAKAACVTAKFDVKDHFRDVLKMVDLGSGAKREINDILLTRYACYLVAQNGDPRKETIAFAQTYFAVQTRKQEVLEERLRLSERLQARAKLTETEKRMNEVLYEHGIKDSKGFAVIKSAGDKALFGGADTLVMKDRMQVPASRSLADFLPAVMLKAKEFAAAITTHNTRENNLQGLTRIRNEHVKNNQDVRQVLIKNDIVPERLPPEEDIKKLERRVTREASPKAIKDDKK